MKRIDRSLACATCGRPRSGLEMRRDSWSADLLPGIPREPRLEPWQIHNDLIARAVVYRNGGTDSETHLCDACLTVGLRALKVEIDRTLEQSTPDADLLAENVKLTKRLASAQLACDQVAFTHDRMQDRLAALLALLELSPDDPRDEVRLAHWEVRQGQARGAPRDEPPNELVRTTFNAEVLTLDSEHEGAIVELLPKSGGRELRVPMTFEQARSLGAHLYRGVRVTVIVDPLEDSASNPKRCSFCDGKGERVVGSWPRDGEDPLTSCPDCDGTGVDR